MYKKDENEDTPSTLVLSLDFDGCTDTPESREKLIDYIADYSQNFEYTEIRVFIGSLRQSVYLDMLNAINNLDYFDGELLSCNVILIDFVKKLSEKLIHINPKIQVIPEKLLTSDIYNNLHIGTTFSLLDKTKYKEIYDLDKASIISSEQLTTFDKNGNPIIVLEKKEINSLSYGNSFHFDDIKKCLILYTINQYLINQYNKSFDLLHFDDRDDLLSHIENYFSNNANLIPSGCSMLSVEWNADDMLPLRREYIKGCGDINHDYIQDVISIGKRCVKDNLDSTEYMHEYFNNKKTLIKNCPTIVKPKAKRAKDIGVKTYSEFYNCLLFNSSVVNGLKETLSPDHLSSIDNISNNLSKIDLGI